MADNYITLEPGKIYGIPLKNGVLRVDVSQDPYYPGLDIEYIDNNEPKDCEKTRPRVLIEVPVDENTGESEAISVKVWADPDNEDYSNSVDCKDYV